MNEHPLVAVVDDSESVRKSLPDLLEQVGFAVHAFASAEAFLDRRSPARRAAWSSMSDYQA